MSKRYFVYIMASASKALYVGVTNNLERRTAEHRSEGIETHAKFYAKRRLVFFEETNDVRVALEREKQLKGWRREKKIALIETMNPEWRDFAEEWGL